MLMMRHATNIAIEASLDFAFISAASPPMPPPPMPPRAPRHIYEPAHYLNIMSRSLRQRCRISGQMPLALECRLKTY